MMQRMPLSKPAHNLGKTAVQTMANISLVLFILPPLGVALSLVALILANKAGNRRAASTATVGLTINLVALALFYILLCFIRELGRAI